MINTYTYNIYDEQLIRYIPTKT